MRRLAGRPLHAVLPMAVGRWQSSQEQNATTPAKEEKKHADAKDGRAGVGVGANAAATPMDDTGKSSEAPHPEVYRFRSDEVMDAVKKRDFSAVQTHATRLVQSQWKESYNVPAACVVVFCVMWYWIAWTRRSIRRKAAATEAAVRQQTEEMVEMVRSMTRKWSGDMAKANQQMQGIIDKNSELTRDIDRMTTALRSCSIRPTPASPTTLLSSTPMAKRTEAAAVGSQNERTNSDAPSEKEET